MSANNWDQCPKCLESEKQRQLAAGKTAASSYGKIEPDKYLKLLEDQKPRELEDSMREDYELGVQQDGSFYVSYRASCEACDFEFRFSHEMTADQVLNPAASKRGQS